MTCLQRSHIVFITFLKENAYKILLCTEVVFQSDVHTLRDFPAHNSSNLAVTVREPSHRGTCGCTRCRSPDDVWGPG